MKIAVKYFGVHLILPENAKYIATDLGGDVWWYEHKPTTGHSVWHTEYPDFELVSSICFAPTPLPWWDTMREVKDILLSKVS